MVDQELPRQALKEEGRIAEHAFSRSGGYSGNSDAAVARVLHYNKAVLG